MWFNDAMLEVFAYAGLGLIVGSFLNVLAVRFHDGRSLLGRSACMSCRRTLNWYDLIPVLSWIFIFGKCRQCGQHISILYPFTEALCGGVFILIGLAHLPTVPAILAFLVSALLIAIARYDITHMLIPDVWVYLFAALSLLTVFYAEDARTLFLQILAGPLATAPFLALWFVSRGLWMGLGDAKLALGIGWLLGLEGGAVAVLGAFVLGAVVGLGLMSVSWWCGKSSPGDGAWYTMKSEIPFGPFLVASCLFVWITQMYGTPIFETFLALEGSLLSNLLWYPGF